MADLIADADVPGLVRPSSKVVRERRVRDWKFQYLKDGSLFVSRWSGAPEDERMVTHELFSADEAKDIRALFEP